MLLVFPVRGSKRNTTIYSQRVKPQRKMLNMADAYKCDRCKNFFDGKPHATVSVRPRDEMGETKFYKSVCDACASVIKDFVEDAKFDANSIAVRALSNSGIDTECGACMSIAFTGLATSEHTCKRTAFRQNELITAPRTFTPSKLNKETDICSVGTCNLPAGHLSAHNQFDGR